MIGFVTGLRAEARIAGRIGTARAGGGTPDGARRAALALVADGAWALVSFGLAGGLDPTLSAGDMVDAAEILADGIRYETDPGLVASLMGRPFGTIVATSTVIATAAEKAALRAETSALAVDLESGAVALVAKKANLPFAVLRAVCDPATRNLPQAALVALDAHGAIGGWRVARAVLGRPRDIAGLLALARDAGLARAALVGRVGQIGCLDADLSRFR